MEVLRLIIQVIFILICIGLTIIVLMQEGKSAGLGNLGGSSDSYWGRNKGRSIEGAIVKSTKFLATAYIILSLVLNLNF